MLGSPKLLYPCTQPTSPVAGDEVPPCYKLFEVGEIVTLIGGHDRTITSDMVSLLGHADNTLARIPLRLVVVSRFIIIANVVLGNMALLPWAERLVVPPDDNAMWVDSLLLYMDRNVLGHILISPERSGKSPETAWIALYKYLVNGLLPVVGVRSHGGRTAGGGGELMEQAVNDLLSEKCGVQGTVPTIRDIMHHGVTVLQPPHLHDNDKSFFFMQARLRAGGVPLTNREAGGFTPWLIWIVLNISSINHIRDYVGSSATHTVLRWARTAPELTWHC